MTKKGYLKHKHVIDWFYNQPEGESVVYELKKTGKWSKTANPEFSYLYDYLINDEYIELRKAIYDGKNIEFFDIGTKKWYENKIEDPNCIFICDVEKYRIKKEIKYPVYKKNQDVIAKFINQRRKTPEFIRGDIRR